MSFTTNEIVLLLLVLVLGWVLGLASRPGGGRWRREAELERERREAAEARIAASNTRIAELERQGGMHPVTAGTAGSIAAAASGKRDDLSLIRGVGADGEHRLNDAGYHSFRQIAGLSDRETAELEGRLGTTPGTIDREEWREQAKVLAARNHEEHGRRWGTAA